MTQYSILYRVMKTLGYSINGTSLKSRMSKVSFYLILLFLVSTSSCSFFNKKNDLDKFNLKGKVWNIQQHLYLLEDDKLTEWNDLNRNSKSDFLCERLLYLFNPYNLEFNEKGNIVNAEIDDWYVKYHFNNDMINGEYWRNDESQEYIEFENIYHKRNLTAKYVRTNHSEDTIRYKYDDKGILSGIISFNRGAVYFEYKDKGKTEEVQFYSCENEMEDKFIFKYDEKGNVSKIILEDDVMIFSYEKYDRHNNWTRCVIKFEKNPSNGVIIATRTIKYDTNDSQVKGEQEQTEGDKKFEEMMKKFEKDRIAEKEREITEKINNIRTMAAKLSELVSKIQREQKKITSQEIKEMQQLFNDLYGNDLLYGESLNVTGEYDENTKFAVKRYVEIVNYNRRKSEDNINTNNSLNEIKCLYCLGTGKKSQEIRVGPFKVSVVSNICPMCGGSGNLYNNNKSLKKTVVKPNIKSILNEQEKE